jgi:hypothetical protein
METPVRRSKSRTSLVANVAGILLLTGLLWHIYRDYAISIAWHCMYGNYAEVAGHRVKLPLSWRVQYAYFWGKTSLIRACPETCSEAEIIVEPAKPWFLTQTDQDESNSIQRWIALLNQRPPQGDSSSLVILHPKPFTLYCKRDDLQVIGIHFFAGLDCYAAKVSYSFAYSGPPAHEQEAESILSTLE